jgi:hypothetical protein
MANSAQSSRRRSAKSDRHRRVQLLKKWIYPAAASSASAQNSSIRSSVVAIGLGDARRHELDKFREPVAAVEAEFRSTVSKESVFRPACYGVAK